MSSVHIQYLKSKALFFKVCSSLGAETAVDGEGEKGERGGGGLPSQL